VEVVVSGLLADLGVALPVLAAPMAGGASTPDLVTAAGRAGSLGFLAAGYQTADALAEQIRTVSAAGVPFGVNVFAPNPIPLDPQAYRDYARALQELADRHGVDLTAVPMTEDDDYWADKIDLLVAEPAPLVTFTFGLPETAVVARLRAAGSVVGQTVTSVDEARQAVERGVDLLVVQSSAAGGHSGTLTPDRLPATTPLPDLLREIGAATDRPTVGAGGLATSELVAEALSAGAAAVAVGTVLLRTPESGASAPHQAALADPARDRTVVTRAFTGRPARGLRNEFTDRFSEVAPLGYPAVHHLTNPLRRAATAAADANLMHLWAGTGYRHATTDPVAAVLTRLAG
jgi:nitronate monooxygenase